MIRPIDVVAFSARSLAASCLRAGWQVRAWDVFGDHDLRQACENVVVGNLVDAVHRISVGKGDGPVLIGSGYETLLDTGTLDSCSHRLMNMPVAAARRLRDPVWWSGLLASHGFRTPACRTDPPGDAHSGRWLIKPRAGFGGMGIREPEDSSTRAVGSVAGGAPIGPEDFFQEWVAGRPHSAVLLAGQFGTRVLAVFEQWIGDRRLGAPGEFSYCGNIGPVQLPGAAADRLHGLASCLAAGSGARGLFGVDFVLAGNSPVPVEFNPRPTSSAELVERIAGQSLLPLHKAALGDGKPGNPGIARTGVAPAAGGDGMTHAKAILYAPADALPEVTVDCHELMRHWLAAGLAADIPRAGTPLRGGDPVVTLFAAGESPRAVRTKILARADQLTGLLVRH